MSLLSKGAGLRDRFESWFIDREFFMRANGQVRFLKISAILQRRIAIAIACVVGIWLLLTVGMAINQISVSFERMSLGSREAKIQSAAERVANYKGRIDDVTKDLQQRQDLLDSVTEQHFGKAALPAPAPTNTEDQKAKAISAAVPEAAGLAHIEVRQIRYAERLTLLANNETNKAAAEIRKFGLNPNALARIDASAQGGPFIPFFGSAKQKIGDPRFTKLASALQRMRSMKHALNSVPTSMPAAIMLISSGFGYRHDPFTGAGAMHGGLDFKGPIGTPILAAADGVITYASRMSGYGNTIEITHANGLVTRYAHLSGFNVSLGQKVSRGIQIARMGSTGRSTGSHLHFEVRLDGVAVNPQNFLEANSDVLEVKTVTGNNAIRATTTKEK